MQLADVTVRYDGDAVEHMHPARWRDRDERGLFQSIDGIGDTLNGEQFFRGVADELLTARDNKDQHGVYVTMDVAVDAEQVRTGIGQVLDQAVEEDPLYTKAKRSARRLGTMTAAGAAAVYAGVEIHDPLTGWDLVAPMTGLAGFSTLENLYRVARSDGDAREAVMDRTRVDRIETIENGEATYCIQYRHRSQVRDDYHPPLTEDGSD